MIAPQRTDSALPFQLKRSPEGENPKSPLILCCFGAWRAFDSLAAQENFSERQQMQSTIRAIAIAALAIGASASTMAQSPVDGGSAKRRPALAPPTAVYRTGSRPAIVASPSGIPLKAIFLKPSPEAGYRPLGRNIYRVIDSETPAPVVDEAVWPYPPTAETALGHGVLRRR